MFCLRSRRRWDHPRRCGENPTIPKYHNDKKGSPPQVRGKLTDAVNRDINSRITPAGAGKTRQRLRTGRLVEDHPRRCGENIYQNLLSFRPPGSPPQVRGKLDAVLQLVMGVGITPAGAGKTFVSKTQSGSNQDHPRRCGENPAKSLQVCDAQGSPPQVRGKLHV